MREDRPFRVNDIVQPSEAFKRRTPWNPALRVFGRITEIDPDIEVETLIVPGQSYPIQRVVDDRTQYLVHWRPPYGDEDINWHRKEMLNYPPPLIALANCAPGEDELNLDDDG